MSDAWRVKRYYDPRVTVPVSILTEIEIPDTLVCLSGAQVGLVRTLLQYATRRITWVSEYLPNHYLAPTNAEWDDIEAFLADLEGRLMTDCVTPLVDAIDRIDATLAAQGLTLSAIEGEISSVASNVGDLLPPLECICAKDPAVNVTNVVNNNWPDYPETENTYDWSNTRPNVSIPSQVDEEACNLAQAWYQAGFELLTEQFLPAWRFGFDDLLPAAAAAIAGLTGGVALPIVIGVYALAELIQELLEIGYESAETNLVNWLYAHKQDIVCPLYLGVKDGGSGWGLWQVVADEVVEPSEDISPGDKVLVNFWLGIVGSVAARSAQLENSVWYQSVPEIDYCIPCDAAPSFLEYSFPPCPGDWDGSVCWEGHLCAFHGETTWVLDDIGAPDVGVWDTIKVETDYRSTRGNMVTVGLIRVLYWDGDSWENICPNNSITNDAEIGELNTYEWTWHAQSEPGNRQIQIQIQGQSGMYETEPYAYMGERVKVTFSQA